MKRRFDDLKVADYRVIRCSKGCQERAICYMAYPSGWTQAYCFDHFQEWQQDRGWRKFSKLKVHCLVEARA